MGTVTFEPTVHLTSNTLAHIHVEGEVDEVFASTEEGLRSRIVEAIRLLAASAGEPVTAMVVDGEVRWPLIVHPDGTFIEATALAETAEGEPASAPRVRVRTGEVPVIAEVPQIAEVPEPAPSPEPASMPELVEEPPAPAVAPLRSDAVRRESAQRDPVQRATPTVEDLLNSRADRVKPRATEGWQGTVRRATGGAISPRPGKAEQSRLDRERIVQRRLDAPRTIVVLNPKGGAHKTTSTLLLAATFGTQRGGATLAWDNNETRGTLGWRAQNAPHHRTAVDLLEHLDSFTEPSQASLAALDTYVRTQVDARFDVLASDEDAAASSTIDAAAFDRLHGVLSRYYRLLIVDPALVDGGPIDFDALSPESRDAWLTAASAIAQRL